MLFERTLRFLFLFLLACAVPTASSAEPPSAATSAYRKYWGPMEPIGQPHAGPHQRPGAYRLSWAIVPKDASPPEKWPWTNGPSVLLKGGQRYFIRFQQDGTITVNEEANLPPQQQQAMSPKEWSIVWYQNSRTSDRIAVRLLVSSATDHGASEPRDVDYWGPMEPQRPPHAGPGQSPGRYRIEWASVPRQPVPSKAWPWKNGPEVALEGGKRYFIQFATNEQVHVHAESALPADEARIAPAPGRAIVWLQNATPDMRIAVRLRPIAPSAAGSALPGARRFTQEFPNPSRKASFFVDGVRVKGDFDTGMTRLDAKPGESALAAAMRKQMAALHDLVTFDGNYDPATGRVSGKVTSREMSGVKPSKPDVHHGSFEGSLKDGVLDVTFRVKLWAYKADATHKLRLIESKH